MRGNLGLFAGAADRARLAAIVADRNSPQKHVWRAEVVLLTADRLGTAEIMRRTGLSKPSVWRWQARYLEAGVDGLLRDRTRPSRIPALSPAKVTDVIRRTLDEPPPGEATHWTVRAMAATSGISPAKVHEIWQEAGLAPHRVRRFKLSTDPAFAEKLEDVVGLYVDPPRHAIVLSLDEKSQVQALDRTQPGLPMKPGRAGTMTHDYKRNGTTDLFAALNVATGEVLYDCRRRHTGADVLAFFKLIDLHVPRDLEVHLVLDNLSTHMSPEVTTWLDHPKRARWHLHFTPTSSSWLNLIERWFKELTDRRLRRGTFSSVGDLIDAIELWTEHWNDDPTPFVWHQTAADIIEKVRRGRAALTQVKSATHH